MISGFRWKVNENCALLGCYAASSCNSLPTFRDNISVPSLRVNPWWRDREVFQNLRQATATVRCVISQKSADRVTKVAQWLRCCAANRKVAVSIPGGVIGIFHWHKILQIAIWPWGSTQPLTEMSARSFSWGLTTLPPSCAVVTKSGNLNSLEPSGPLQACNGTALHLPASTGVSIVGETKGAIRCT